MDKERYIDTPAYDAGWTDGYYGYGPHDESPAYDAGYAQGEDDREQELADAYRDDLEMQDGLLWDAVEMGVYDDDPNPYHGDYSEM